MDLEGGETGKGGQAGTLRWSRNPGYAHEMRSRYGIMTYAYCTHVIGKI